MTESKNMFKIPNNNLHPNIFWKSFLNKCIKSKETIGNLNKIIRSQLFFLQIRNYEDMLDHCSYMYNLNSCEI